VLDLKILEVNRAVGNNLLGTLLELGKQKFSSNVIEKCLESTTPDIQCKMVEEIMQAKSFYEFLIDQYGNYVI